VAEHREEPARHEEGVDAHSGLLDDVRLGLLWLAAGPARAANARRAEIARNFLFIRDGLFFVVTKNRIVQ